MALGIVNMPVDAVAISHLDDVSSSTAVAASKQVTITWTDPEDLYYENATVAKWAGTVLVRKIGSAPRSRFDGDVVVDNEVRNQYAVNGFVDDNLVNGTVYYYRFFPHDITGNYRPGTTLSAQPAPYTTALPTVTSDFTYNGSGQSPELSYDSDVVIVSGTEIATDAGVYSLTFSLKDDDHVWSDGSYTDKTRTWIISPEVVTKPTIKSGQESFVFNSNFQSPELDNFNAIKMTQSGQTSRMTVGDYTMTITLSSDNYVWENEDADTRSIQLAWSITKAPNVMTLSADSGNVVYGESTTFVVTSNPSGGTLSVSTTDTDYVDVSISGSTVTVESLAFKSSNIAVTVTSAETANYESGTAVFTVIPQKAAGSLLVGTNSITLTTDTTVAYVQVTRAGDGLIQVSSSDTDTAVVSLNTDTAVLTITGVKGGTATVTVSVLAGSNHYAPNSKSISVGVSFLPDKKSFNDTSWEDIAFVTQAGKASEYWNVGDTKDMQFASTVTMSSGSIPANTTYKVVILGFDHNSELEGTNRLHLGISKNSAGTKDICFRGQRINNSDTNTGGWASCEIKSWLNETLYSALPTELKNVITECIKYTNNTGSNKESDVTPTSQKIWLFSEFEVFGGSRNYANSYEKNKQAQYDYYKNGNGVTRYNHANNNSATTWWMRSPFVSNTTQFCYVRPDAPYYGGYTGQEYNGIVPCFTIS